MISDCLGTGRDRPSSWYIGIIHLVEIEYTDPEAEMCNRKTVVLADVSAGEFSLPFS